MIPLYKPNLGELEKKNLIDAFDSSWISSQGVYLQRFEEKLANYTSRRFCVCVSNGTTALHTALLTLGINKDDEIITNSFSYVATANAIRYVGAKPVFVDACINTWNIDVERIKNKITSKTKAIVIANLYGNITDIDAIEKLAIAKNLYLIEDAAESIGSSLGRRMSGSFGDISTFSFFGNKTITTGEGGAVLMNSDKLYSKAKQLINQGNSLSIRYYHDDLGYNYRMTNIQAAIGVAQLERIADILRLKKKIYDAYYNKLCDYVTFQSLGNNNSSHWLISVLFESEDRKNQVADILQSKGVDSRPFFYPIPDLPYYETNVEESLIARKLRAQGLSLPSYPDLKMEEIEFITNTIISTFK